MGAGDLVRGARALVQGGRRGAEWVKQMQAAHPGDCCLFPKPSPPS